MRISLKWFLIGSAVIAAVIGLGKRYYDHKQWLAAPATAGSRATFDPHRYFQWVAEQKAKQQEIREALRGSGFQWDEKFTLIAITVTASTDRSRLPMLSEATALEDFHSQVRLSDADLLWAKNHPNLRRLEYIEGITDRSLAVIGSCRQLERLLIRKSPITDEGLGNLGGLDQLALLELHDSPITGQGLASLSRLSQLYVADCPVNDEGLKAIGQLQELQECTLGGAKFDGTGLPHLASLSKLRKLALSSQTLTDTSGLGELDSVETLVLYGKTPLKPGTLRPVADMDSLRCLRIYESGVADELLGELAGAHQILDLELCDTSISDTGLAHLESLTGLRKLNLGSKRITDAGLTHLEKLTGLGVLNLSSTEVTEAGARRLAQALPHTRIGCRGMTIDPKN
jgi:Leucine-rich repeat (LRR) protein